MFNDWMKRLALHEQSLAGHRDFIEFTLDENNFEIAEGTPMSNEHFDAVWAKDPAEFPSALMPVYHSSWAYIYHPDLIERARPSGV